MARCSVHTMHMQNEIANELKAKMVTPKVTKREKRNGKMEREEGVCS